MYDIQKKTINYTKDMDIENKRLQYQFCTVNNHPDVYKTTQKQQEKYAEAKAKNESLKTNLDIQKQTKKVQMENSLLIATHGIINETIDSRKQEG